MIPDRSNYDSWLAGWLEGTLDVVRSEMFLSFLDKNPDLKAEAELLSLARLSPDNSGFRSKSTLKRRPEELNSGQIEYLSAAYLENDLSEEQITELFQNLQQNRENNDIFNTVLKTRLVPPAVEYRYKRSLKKLTSAQKIFRIAVVSMSAAAAITLLILTRVFSSGYDQAAEQGIASGNTETIPRDFSIARGVPITLSAGIVNNEVLPANISYDPVKTNDVVPAPAVSLSFPVQETAPTLPVPVIDIAAAKGLQMTAGINTLAAYRINYTQPEEYDDRSRIRKFIARTFREKILRDEIQSDTPLKPYELARAGVDGLNRLLDWEMEITETYDETGNVKSVYFSSALLTFNAPVKKSEPGE